jgi:hypothetical protein
MKSVADPQTILDKALGLMDAHLFQIKVQATAMTKDGAKGFTATDAAVIERYAKLALAMTKSENEDTDLEGLTDEELLAKLNESNPDVQDTASET